MKNLLLVSTALCFINLPLIHAGENTDKNQAGFNRARQMTHEFLKHDTNTPEYAGKVVETFQSGGYTYLRFKQGTQEYWAATNRIAVQKGDEIVLNDVYPMHDFYSKSLDRTFKSILFTSSVMKR
jgi:hypothetical protein